MTEPGGRGSPRAARVSESGLGTEGDGWNDDFQFTARSPRGSDGGKRTPPRSPRGGAGASSTGTRNHTGNPVGGADAETSPGSGSSRGSPDENQNAGQIPGASGRRRSFTDGFTAPSTDPTASPPAPQRRSVSPFEQRRRQALLDKQRRLEDMMERIRAPDSPEKAGTGAVAVGARSATHTSPMRTPARETSSTQLDVSTDGEAWTPVTRRDDADAGTPVRDTWDELEAPVSTPVRDTWDELEAPVRTPRGPDVRTTRGHTHNGTNTNVHDSPDASSARSMELSPETTTGGYPSSVGPAHRRLTEDELVARYRVFARKGHGQGHEEDDEEVSARNGGSNGGRERWPFSRNPSGGSEICGSPAGDAARPLGSIPASSPPENAVTEPISTQSQVATGEVIAIRSSPAKSPAKPPAKSPVKSPPGPIELPRVDSIDSNESIDSPFGTPADVTPSGQVNRIEITTEPEEDEHETTRNEATRYVGGLASPTTAESRAVADRSRVPLTHRAAKFMATLGAARRGSAEDRAGIRRRLGLPAEAAAEVYEERVRRPAHVEEEDDDDDSNLTPVSTPPSRKPRSLTGTWLSDSAAAASLTPPPGTPRSPRMPSITEEAPAGGSRERGSRHGYGEDSPPAPSSEGTPYGYSPANSTPTPPRTPMRGGFSPTNATPSRPPRSPAPGAAQEAKAAAARKLLQAASPVKTSPQSQATFVPASPAPSTSSAPSPGHDPGKAAAARRIMLAAAAKKAAAGADESGSKNVNDADDDFGLDVLFSPVTKVGGVSGEGVQRGGGVPIDTRVVSAQRQLGFTREPDRPISPPSPINPPGAAASDGEIDSAFEFRSPTRPAVPRKPLPTPTTDVDTDGEGSDAPWRARGGDVVSDMSDTEPETATRRSGDESSSDYFSDPVAVKRHAEIRVHQQHEAEVRAQIDRLNRVPPPPSVAPERHVANSQRVVDAVNEFETDYETDAGYGTAMDTLVPLSDTGTVLSNPRALRVALEKAEMRLEEAGWEKEALETRLAEAESSLARTDAVNGARISQLSAEVQQNDYLRRLLKRAEEMRNAARMQAKEARVRLDIRERELEQRRIEIDRMEAERDGLRRRILTEKRRADAMENIIEVQNAQLEESQARRVTMTQLAGMLVCFLVVLWMRIKYGPREPPVIDIEPPKPSNVRTIEFGRDVGTHTPLRRE